jgi:hypothetical protein
LRRLPAAGSGIIRIDTPPINPQRATGTLVMIDATATLVTADAE